MVKGLNNHKMQQSNRSLILSTIIENRGISRLGLSEVTGLQKPTITNIVNELLELGIIESGEAPKREGRNKTKGLAFTEKSIVILSARLTRDLFSACIYNMNGEMIDSCSCVVYPTRDIMETLEKSVQLIDALLKRNMNRKVLSMCLGLPGPYIRGEKEKIIVEGFPGLGKVDVCRFYAEHYAFPLLAEHDAHLSALCEWKSLTPEEQENARCLLALQSLGIGIGAGIILDGKIVKGAFGIAGEIGSIGINFNGQKNSNGQRGTLETYASTGNLRRYIGDRLIEFPNTVLTEHSTYDEIREAYLKGDPLANWIFDAAAARLAYGLASSIFVINPDMIIIGPDYPETDRFIGRIQRTLNELMNIEISSRIKIRYSRVTCDPTLLGGYYYILQVLTADNTLLERVKEALAADR